MPQSARSERASRSPLAPSLLWAALWLVFTLVTGTPHAALLCWPKIANVGFTLLFVVYCLLRTAGQTPKGRPLLLFTAMMRAWGTAPVTLWLAALLWVGAFAYSVTQATMPRLALEKAGEFGWKMLLCALIFGYAARGWQQWRRIQSGILMAGDAVLLLFCTGQSAIAFPDRVYAVFYAALLLPLTIWDIRNTRRSRRPKVMARFIWGRARMAILLAFFALSLPPLPLWAGLGEAWPGLQTLAQQRPLSGLGPGAFNFYWPQFIGENGPREAHFPGFWARFVVENGVLAPLGCVLLVLTITVGGVAKAGAHRTLGVALRISIALFCILGLWLSPEGAPALEVTFLAILALAAALRWGPGLGIHSEKAWPHENDAPLVPHSAFSRTVVLFLALGGIAFSLWRVPSAWKQTRAHWLNDLSLQQSDPQKQLALLQAAIKDDPAQPAYWIHLAQARLRRDGPQASRTGASYLRVALHRAAPRGESPDAALWHEIAQLAYQAGDFDRALAMAQRAVHYDPYCCDYRLLLAACYALHGDTEKAETERKNAVIYLKNAPGHAPGRYLRRLKPD